jgi:L-alanine-DL-glutamate epimerase-like enolase superfamily enzyme
MSSGISRKFADLCGSNIGTSGLGSSSDRNKQKGEMPISKYAQVTTQIREEKYLLEALREMAKYDLEYAEQPVPNWDLDGMARVRKEVGIPVAADESLFSSHDAIKLIQMEAADVFNIKVVKGGLNEAKKIAAVAEAAGLPCVVGAMAELGVGTAAGIHFGVSTKNIDYACECCGATFYDADIIRDLILPQKGSVAPPEGFGLGVELDEAKVDSMRVALESEYKIQFKRYR